MAVFSFRFGDTSHFVLNSSWQKHCLLCKYIILEAKLKVQLQAVDMENCVLIHTEP